METEKLNELVRNNPNKLYTLLAGAKAVERNRFGKFGKKLYVPHNEFVAEKVMHDIEEEARRNIFKKEYDEKNKRRKSSF